MTERIEKLLEETDMSPSLFADAIGVQRATISHILSGRNNPSLDFVQKVLARFPKLNPDWILSGKGSIWREAEKDAKAEENARTRIREMAVQPKLFADEAKPASEAVNTDAQQLLAGLKQHAAVNFKLPETPDIGSRKTEKEKEIAKTAGRIIKRVIIFYDDHTFEAFSEF